MALLVNLNDLALTLGREPAGCQPATATGWARSWNAVVNNLEGVRKFYSLNDGSIPQHVLALNLLRHSELRANGLLIPVSQAELQAFDGREASYDRIEITEDIIDEHNFDKIFTYIAKPSQILEEQNAIIPKSYLDVVHTGFRDLGEDHYSRFFDGTLASAAKIIPTVLA